ncbi:DUF4432 family protein [Devosia algicola]|uniref:DUF4432 family protein n=1 Tax=Devosia algicola TaxID=3026418 RepID=A0ABY7YQK9_9HYPH|nr:DUF4432 family protein [Devosia algicola]WDR03472.1 DUF4432 family protein [Devosia algicola]
MWTRRQPSTSRRLASLWKSSDHDPFAAFGPPVSTHQSEISVHRPNGQGLSTCRLVNPTRGLELAIAFDSATLPFLQLLRLRGAGYYMVGIEPCTAAQRNRTSARQAGEIPLLQPGEGRDFSIEVAATRTRPLQG